MQKPEAQTIEYKSSWQDDYFGWIAGYANASGGTLYIGVNDDGYVVGLKDSRFLLDTLPNQISSFLTITVSIDHDSVEGLGHNLKYQSVPKSIAQKPENLYARGILKKKALEDIDAAPEETGNVTPEVQRLFDAAPGFVKQLRKSQEYRTRVKANLERWEAENPVHISADGTVEYVWIQVTSVSYGVPYHGRYYIRSGGTTQELKGAALSSFLHDRVGKKWDSVAVSDVTLDRDALNFLRERAVNRGRLTKKKASVSDKTLIRNLEMLTKEGEFTRAAAMLFGNPEDIIFGSYIRIGFFGGVSARLKYQDEVHGPLISQAHRATEMIFDKYLKGLVDIKGLQRTETYMTTEELLREVILNAIAHKYYPSCVPVQIKIYDDHITVTNDGFWPFEDLAVEDVYTDEHASYPINPLIGNGFFFAGEMETWGQGFLLIKEECEKIEAPLPEIKATEKHVTVTIRGCKKYMELLNSNIGSDIGTNLGTRAEESAEDRFAAIVAFCAEARSKAEIQEHLGIKSESYVRQKLLNPLLKEGRLMRTKENNRSRNQKYIATKTEMERAQAILDNNPVLAMSPGDLKREGRTVEEYLENFKESEREFYKDYYSDEI